MSNCLVLTALMLLGVSVTLVSCSKDDDGPTVEYAVDPAEVVLTSERGAGGSFAINFTGKAESSWRITQIPDFVTVYPQSGTGSGTVRITANENNNGNNPLEGLITIQVDDASVKTKTVKVVQQNLEGCYTEPTNILQMCDGLAFNWEFGPNTKYYYWELISQNDYSRMSQSEILKKVATGNVSDRCVPDNTDYACNYNLNANTQYVVVTVSYAEGDRQGEVVATPLSTKPTTNQPLAEINDMSYYTDNSNNYYYGWTSKKNTYCSQYYTYAAASTSLFWTYYLLDEGAYSMVAWLIKNEIQKNGEDHTTSINQGFAYYPFNNGRDQFYAAQVNDGTTYFSALPYSDKYFFVLTWGTGANGELSGKMDANWYEFTNTDSSSAKSGKLLKAVSKKAKKEGPKSINVNMKDFKLMRLY